MANEEEVTQEEPKAGKPWLLIALAALLALGAGAGGTFFLLGSREASAAKEPASAEKEEAKRGSFSERVFELDPFVVNVSGEGYPRYLKMEVAFEMDSVEGREEIATRVAQVRDATILLLSSKRLADVTEFEGKALLKDDLRDRVNALIEDGNVESVLFTEFVVQ